MVHLKRKGWALLSLVALVGCKNAQSRVASEGTPTAVDARQQEFNAQMQSYCRNESPEAYAGALRAALDYLKAQHDQLLGACPNGMVPATLETTVDTRRSKVETGANVGSNAMSSTTDDATTRGAGVEFSLRFGFLGDTQRESARGTCVSLVDHPQFAREMALALSVGCAKVFLPLSASPSSALTGSCNADEVVTNMMNEVRAGIVQYLTDYQTRANAVWNRRLARCSAGQIGEASAFSLQLHRGVRDRGVLALVLGMENGWNAQVRYTLGGGWTPLSPDKQAQFSRQIESNITRAVADFRREQMAILSGQRDENCISLDDTEFVRTMREQLRAHVLTELAKRSECSVANPR